MIRTDDKSQAEARDYVLNRPLTRPSTTIWAPITLFLAVIVTGIGVGLFISTIIKCQHTAAFIVGFTLFLLLCLTKPLLILCILCYQHYAPDHLRRSCLCKPTCSEYAILVLKKYCIIKALVLIYIRLFKTCSGKVFLIDTPDN